MSGLGKVAMRGTSWAVAARLGRSLIAIVTLSVLSRILTPADFGVAAMILFVTALATLFADFGTRIALVQRKEISELDANSVYWSNLVFCLVITLAVVLTSEYIADFMDAPELGSALRWVSPVFLLGGLQAVPMSMLERAVGFRKIAIAEFSASLGGAATAIILALNGFQLGALVAQQVAVSVISTVLIIAFSKWRPKFQFSFASFYSLLGYGSYVTGAGMLQFLSVQTDKPLVQKYLSSADLGFYSMTQQMVATPVQVIVQMARKVMFPILSQIQDDDTRMKRGIAEVQYGLVLIMAPVCLGLLALADPIVSLLLGSGWEVVAAIMGLTTLRALVDVYVHVNSVLFASKGQARFQFKWSIFVFVTNLVVVLFTVRYGLVTLLYARLALAVCLMVGNTWFVSRLVGYSMADKFLITLRPITSAVIMTFGVMACDRWLLTIGWDLAIVRILIGIPLGIAIYCGSEIIIDRTRFVESVQRIKSMRKS